VRENESVHSIKVSLIPPQSVADEAELGLVWRKKYRRGGTAVGVARARQLKNRQNLSLDTIKRMVSYFARHGYNEGKNYNKDNEPTAHWIAWKLWGGNAGRTWARKVARQIKARHRKNPAPLKFKAKLSYPMGPLEAGTIVFVECREKSSGREYVIKRTINGRDIALLLLCQGDEKFDHDIIERH
jgi:hypothetical protein